MVRLFEPPVWSSVVNAGADVVIGGIHAKPCLPPPLAWSTISAAARTSSGA